MLVGVSLSWLSVLALTSGCSSDPVDDDNKGGTGTILGEAGSDGDSSGAGTGSTGGSASGGTASGGSATAGSGGSGGGCVATGVSCLDDQIAQACNPDTGMVETGVCSELFAEEGLISNGCSTDAEGAGCTIDGFEDEECADGAVGFAVCGGFTQDDFFNIYVACFQNTAELRAGILCFAEYVDVEATTVDCEAALPVCEALLP